MIRLRGSIGTLDLLRSVAGISVSFFSDGAIWRLLCAVLWQLLRLKIVSLHISGTFVPIYNSRPVN